MQRNYQIPRLTQENAGYNLDAFLDILQFLEAGFEVGEGSKRTFLIFIQSLGRFGRVWQHALLGENALIPPHVMAK